MVWLLPSHLSEATRCASTEDHQAPAPPLFREHRYQCSHRARSLPPQQGGLGWFLNCARRTTTALSWAFREQGEATQATLSKSFAARPPSEPSEVPAEAALPSPPVLTFLNPFVGMPKVRPANPPEE